jgi:hypothetical protein
VVAVLVAVGLLVSACSNSGLSLARQACTHVDRSIRLYARAEHDTDATTARREQTEATAQLEEALPLAAAANSANPTWNPLMTTLQEIGRMSESNLIPALEAQCAAAAHPATSQVPVSGPGTAQTGTSR